MPIIKKIKNKINVNRDVNEVIKKSSSSMLIRILGLCVNYLFLFFITLNYGAGTWGVFILCLSIIQITGLIAGMGFNMALIKITAQNELSLSRIYKKVLSLVLPVNLIISVAVFCFSDILGAWLSKDGIEMTSYIQLASLGILPFSITVVNGGIFRGKKRIITYSFYDSLGRFFLGGVFVLILNYLLGQEPHYVVLAFILGLYLLFIFSMIGVLRIIKNQKVTITENGERENSVLDLLNLSIPLFWANFMNIGTVYSSALILGFFLTKEDVGLFDVASRLAGSITMILYAVNSISAAKFAESANDRQKLKKNVQYISKIMFYASIAVLIMLITFGPPILYYLEFDNVAVLVFLIILFGRFVGVISGSVGTLMQMIGLHKLSMKISISSFVLVIACLILIVPVFGLEAAAIIVSANLILRNVYSVILVYRKLGVLTFYWPRSYQRVK